VSLVQIANILFVRQRRILIAVFLVVLAAVAVLTFVLPKRYEATATLVVGENRAISTGATAVQLDEVLAETYAELLGSSVVARQVASALPFPTEPGDIDEKFNFEVLTGTRLIEIRASDGDPGRAQTLANTMAGVFVRNREQSASNAGRERLRQLNGRIGALAQRIGALKSGGADSAAPLAQAENELEAAQASYKSTQENISLQGSNVALASPAGLPAIPARPRPKLYIALGAVLALVLAAAAAFLRNVFDKRVRDEDELTEIMGVPLLGRVPLANKEGTGDEIFGEAFQFLRANLQSQDIDGSTRVVGITSALPGDGKSNTVYQLARALALGGKGVIAVDCDLRKPALAGNFGIEEGGRGVTNVLVGSYEPARVLAESSGALVRVVPSGPVPPNPSVLLTLPRFSFMLEQFRAEGGYVLLDTPPVTAGAETSAISAAVDALVLVVDLERSRRDALIAARDQLAQANAPLIGIVLNRVSRTDSAYGYYRQYRDEKQTGDGAGGEDRASRRARRRGRIAS
jgi:capsular exopolysaccharide synthesis family protein